MSLPHIFHIRFSPVVSYNRAFERDGPDQENERIHLSKEDALAGHMTVA